MIEVLREVFLLDDDSPCLSETNNACIEVYDCYDCEEIKRRSFIRTNALEPSHFTLKNSQGAKLTFAAVDNCIMNTRDGSRCDFVIGNFQELYFVEVKQVSLGHRSSARKSAIVQLYSTIVLFKERIDLTQTSLKAVICLKAKKIYPAIPATKTAEIVRFKEQLNVDLLEGQSATFLG